MQYIGLTIVFGTDKSEQKLLQGRKLHSEKNDNMYISQQPRLNHYQHVPSPSLFFLQFNNM